MTVLRTFKRGGVHPLESKYTENEPIRSIKPGKKVIIPLQQHIGAPATPIVKKGEHVEIGQLIATPPAAVSSPIHSSVAGKIKNIVSTMTPVGSRVKSIEIIPDSEQEQPKWKKNENIDLSDKKLLLKKIKDAGIVGMGGATFPTHIKLSPPPDVKIDTLIINGAECEPYLTADHRLMLEKGESVVLGAQILMKILGLEYFYIGIENNKPDVIKLFTELSNRFSFMNVVALKTKYPQGAEKQLIKAITNREVPSGKLPFHVGCVVQNAGTAFAVYEAVYYDKPLIERIITVSGSGIKKPSNLLVKVGTLISDIINACEGTNEGIKKIIAGGPMMGKAVKSIDIPVIKGTSGLLFFTEKEVEQYKEKDCIRCGLCVSVCPQGLVPCDLATYSEYGELKLLNDIMDCVECGSCAYTCPSNRRLVHWIRLGKSKLKAGK